jgi:hypothetical protein
LLVVVVVHAARALILLRLWANTPWPHQIRAPGRLVEAGAIPAGSAFEVGDAAFAAGAPLL